MGVDLVDHSKVYNREPDGKLGAGPGSTAHQCPARFVQADALKVLEGIITGWGGVQAAADAWGHFDLICASPPCQAHSSLRHLQAGKVYPDLIEPVRELLQRWGGLWAIENVPGAPLGGSNLTMLCGTMFGLQTPDGRAELRRHRLFETSFSIPLRPACQHGHESLSVCGSGLDSGKERYRRRALSVTGHAAEISPSNWLEGPSKSMRRAISVTGQKGLPGLSRERRKVLTVVGHTPVDNTGRQKVICVGGGKAMSGGMSKSTRGKGIEEYERRTVSVTGATPQAKGSRDYGRLIERETFSTDDARHAMGIDWMPMKQLSQAIPPAYASWIGEQALAVLAEQGRRRA